MLRHLRVRRPLVFFDVETSGLDPRRDRIVEVALMGLAPGLEPQPLSSLQPGWPDPTRRHRRPRHHERARRALPHLRREGGQGDPPARRRRPGRLRRRALRPAVPRRRVRAGRLGLPLRGRKVVDAMTLFHRLEPRDLAAAVRRYCGREHAQAHRAGHDVAASAAVLYAMLGRHKDVPRAVDAARPARPGGRRGLIPPRGAVDLFACGKHRDVPLEDVARRDPSYLDWLADRVLPDARRLIESACATGPTDTTNGRSARTHAARPPRIARRTGRRPLWRVSSCQRSDPRLLGEGEAESARDAALTHLCDLIARLLARGWLQTERAKEKPKRKTRRRKPR